VLMVEDNLVNQRVQQKLLQMLGIDCDIACNGRIGVDMFVAAHEAGKPYDLVVMDCHMPEMDGFEATKLMREFEQKRKLAHTHILALTAGSGMEQCMACGMCNVMSKPVRKATFEAELNKYFTITSC
jgi:two-component system, sensor histidine kinase